LPDYCAFPDIHNRLQDLSTDYDTLITELCGEATQMFTEETGRRFDATTGIVYRSGNGRRTLFVNDLAALTGLRVRTSTSTAWVSITLTPAEGVRLGDIVLGPEDRFAGEPAQWIRIIDYPSSGYQVWPAGPSTVEITGTLGFVTVPVDVKDACIELVVAMLRDRGVAVGGSIGGGSLDQLGRPRTYPDITYRAMQKRRRQLVA